MEATLIWVVVILFVIALMIFSMLAKNSTLDKLTTLEGEKTLLEEDGVTVEESVRGKSIKTIFRNCVVRLTNKRVIIAQAVLFNKQKKFLRIVINYVDKGPELKAVGGVVMNTETFKQGYLTLYTTKDRIAVEETGGEKMLVITAPLAEKGALQEPHVWVHTQKAAEFKNAVR